MFVFVRVKICCMGQMLLIFRLQTEWVRQDQISLEELKTSGLETKNDINHVGPSTADIVYIVNTSTLDLGSSSYHQGLFNGYNTRQFRWLYDEIQKPNKISYFLAQ